MFTCQQRFGFLNTSQMLGKGIKLEEHLQPSHNDVIHTIFCSGCLVLPWRCWQQVKPIRVVHSQKPRMLNKFRCIEFFVRYFLTDCYFCWNLVFGLFLLLWLQLDCYVTNFVINATCWVAILVQKIAVERK